MDSLSIMYSRVRFKSILIFTLIAIIFFTWLNIQLPVVSSKGKILEKKPKSNEKKNLSQKSKEESRTDCGIDLPYLNAGKLRGLACEFKFPLEDSCKLTRSIFSGEVTQCDKSEKVSYCSLVAKDVKCDLVNCQGHAQSGYLNIATGHMIWREHQSPDRLSQAIRQLIDQGGHSNYVYIRCPAGTQLLILPDKPVKRDHVTNEQRTSVSINMLLLDSVSYFHFHRSLPKTVGKLKDLQHSADVKVLSYPLFQSIKSRTFENMQALFGGVVDTKQTFSTQGSPKSPLLLQETLQPLRDKGYENLFLEDLCWTWEWGISKDLLVHNKSLGRAEYWRNLWKAFHVGGITSYGISPAGCEVLLANGKPDPFHGVPAVCYNGRYHHSYIFEYLAQYQQQRVDAGIPYTSFYGSNTPHDEDGTRIKTLDVDLANHIEHVTKQTNTLTIIFSDHGNAYGTFPQSHQQGRDETYHPIFYMIVPKGAQLNLGEEVMRNLIANQGRLVTMLDIHYLLKYIATPAKAVREGLVSTLSPERTCQDLTLYQPNICICNLKDEIVLSDVELFLLAEFASAQISKSMMENSGGAQNMKCYLLLPVNYSHTSITTRKDGHYAVSMDIHFTSPSKSLETIFVTISYKPASHGSTTMTLLANERRSPYSPYRPCGDGPITESLCICQTGVTYSLNIADNWLTDVSRYSDTITHRESHQLNSCIYIVRYLIGGYGCSLYAVNICTEPTYHVIAYGLDNLKTITYSNIPVNGWYLVPKAIQFLTVLHSKSSPSFPNTSFMFRAKQS